MKQIWADYEVVCQNVTKLLREPNQNFTVTQPHYIYPSVTSIKVSMQDPNGEYQYFLKIRAALEEALAFGVIPEDILPYKSPKYLCDLVRS